MAGAVPERGLSEADLESDRCASSSAGSTRPGVRRAEANAMAVATTRPDGIASVRMVLLDQADERGFAFQTNLDSPKGQHLAANPRAALLFFWPKLLRQVRVTGNVSHIPRPEVSALFAQAPPGFRPCCAPAARAKRSPIAPSSNAGMTAALRRGAAGRCADAEDWGGFASARPDRVWQGRANPTPGSAAAYASEGCMAARALVP